MIRQILAAAGMLAMAIPAPAQAAAPVSDKVASLCRVLLTAPIQGSAPALALMGDCALALGDVAGAVRHYRAALRLDPANLAVRADLANLLLLTGQVEAAKPVLRASVASNSAQPEAAILAGLADHLDGGPAPAALAPTSGGSASIALGRVYDSNINSGSGSSTFDAIIAGTLLKLTVADAARGRPGWATDIVGRASYMHVLDAGNAVVLSGDLGATIYDAASAFSHVEAAMGVGLVHNTGNLTWSVTPNMQLRWQDNAMAQMGLFIDGRAHLMLDRQLAVTGFGTLGYNSVTGNAGFSGMQGLLGGGLEYALNDDVLFGVQLAVKRQVSASATEAFTKAGPRVFVQASLTDSLALDLGYGYGLAWYDQTSPAFPQARRDSQHEVSAGLSQDLSAWRQGLSVQARYSYQHTDSTADFFDRDRHMISTALKYSF